MPTRACNGPDVVLHTPSTTSEEDTDPEGLFGPSQARMSPLGSHRLVSCAHLAETIQRAMTGLQAVVEMAS